MVALEMRSGRKGRLRGEGKFGGLMDIVTIFIPAIVSWCVGEAQSRLTVCNPLNCGPPGSSVREILQARTAERVPISSPGDLPDAGMGPRDQTHISRISCVGRLVLLPLVPPGKRRFFLTFST